MDLFKTWIGKDGEIGNAMSIRVLIKGKVYSTYVGYGKVIIG
jgi:hypothetical protein